MGSEAVRVLVVGTGSVGRRHIVNLLRAGAEVSAFSYRGLPAVAGVEGVRVFGRLEEALASVPDAVVVANPTDMHVDVALAAARSGQHLFIEKPLSNSLRGVDALAHEAESRGLVVETGFMLRFHPNLKWMKAFMEAGGLGEVHYARAVFGQHLPDWRPGTDHRRCYSARRGVGGVIFDLVHELDLMGWFFGSIAEVSAMTAFAPSLEIESEAIAEIGLRFRSGMVGQVHLDYLRPVYARTLEFVGAEGVLAWDYSAETVRLADRGGESRVMHQVAPGWERNDMFLDYIRHFLARVSDRTLAPAASLADGIAALRAALASHQSALGKRTVDPLQIAEHFSVVEATV